MKSDTLSLFAILWTPYQQELIVLLKLEFDFNETQLAFMTSITLENLAENIKTLN